MRAFLVLGAVLVAAGCSGGGSAGSAEPTARATAPIQGGTDDTTHDFTVGIEIDLGGGEAVICTGQLLAPNLVATARHCVQKPSADAVVCGQTTFGETYAAASYVVTTSPVMEAGQTRYNVVKLIVPTGSDESYVCGNDIALLVLAQNVTLPQYVVPVLSPPMTDHAVWATTETAIGYGVDSPQDEAGSSAGTRRIRENIAFECIPNDPSFTDCFTSSSTKGAIAADEFWSGDGVCEGDSGGGAFDQTQFNAGNWVSFGVAVRGGVTGDGTTCLGSIYTRFDAWPELLVSAATEASQMGNYPLPAWVANAANDDAGFLPSDPASGPGGIDGNTDGSSSKGGCTVAQSVPVTHPWGWGFASTLLLGCLVASRRRPRAA